MPCKLRWCYRTVLLAAAWMPCNVFPAQLEEATPLVNEAEPAPVPADNVEAGVDLALIEFLGQWETDDGEWLAPSDLADEAFVELIETMGYLEAEEID
jgi:hypothetical protein